VTAISDRQRQVLRALADRYQSERNVLFFKGIVESTGLEHRVARLAVRALARKGFAERTAAFDIDDGTIRGSGYSCTPAGYNFFHSLQERAV
jgi:hypothetical protein